MSQMGGDRPADEKTFERERGVLRHPRSLPGISHVLRVTPAGLADGLGLGLSLGNGANTPHYSGPPNPATARNFGQPEPYARHGAAVNPADVARSRGSDF